MKTKLVDTINEDACIEFLRKYGKGQLSESMKIFSLGEDNISDKFNKWFFWKCETKQSFNGTPKRMYDEKYCIDEIVFTYDWGKLKENNWREIFQYIHDVVNNK